MPFAVFAVAFGVLEAAVVVELRRALDPGGTLFPFLPLPPEIVRAERLREAATIVLLATAAHQADRRPATRFAAFLVLFGAWDLVYYAALWVLLGWPAGLESWDLLFLLPVRWYGPVYAPVVVAATMVACGALGLRRCARPGGFAIGARHVAGAVGGGAFVLASFVVYGAPDAPPARYRFELLVVGLGIGLGAFVAALRAAPSATAPAPPPAAGSSSAGAPTSTAPVRRAPQPRAGR